MRLLRARRPSEGNHKWPENVGVGGFEMQTGEEFDLGAIQCSARNASVQSPS